jgi:hypothetical protein
MQHETYTWAVVSVWRGIPSGVELFSRKVLAKRREQELRAKQGVEDEVSVFQIAVPKKVADD